MSDVSMTFSSPLGDGTLAPVAFQGDEAVSRPFRYAVTLIAPGGPIKTTSLLRQPVCLSVERSASAARHFHGLIRSITRTQDIAAQHNRYEAEIVPTLWFASQTIDCRVFHDSTSADIIRKVLEENGVSGDGLQMAAMTLPKRIFTVQYNESDLDFISRLMEEDGIFYFFRHSAGGHAMCIGNANTVFPATGSPVVAVGSGIGGIAGWRRARTSSVRETTLLGYNAKQVSDIEGKEPTTAKGQSGTSRDLTYWYGRTREAAVTKQRARYQQEAADVHASLSGGNSENQMFFAGGRFEIEPVAGEADGAAAGEFIIKAITHSATVGTNSDSSAGAARYSNSFICFRAADTYRTPAVTPRPSMGGVHLAVVLAPDGEEIHVTDEGRIRVRLLWDHRKEATAANTIEVRVMQPWTGNGWGMQHIPRVGTEVAVAFINGDPDDPIVVGSLYNGTNKHPFPLPGEKTKSGIRTRSTLKGGTADFNEFFLDDKKGSELVSLHAQKDHKIVVENDQTTHVMHDQKLTVDNCRIRYIKKDETVTIDGKQALTVKGDRSAEISEGNESLLVKMGNITTKASMGNIDTKASLGNVSIKADVGKVTVEAMQAIELKVGASSIKIDQTGVSIKGMMVKIEGTMMTDVKGLMTKVDGSAMTMVKGAITMIG